MNNDIQDVKARAIQFAKEHPMGVLSTVSANGKPWGSAIYYVTDEELNCFFVTRAETAKYKNIKGNPRVALTVADSATQATLQISGTISHVPAKDIIEVVFKKLAAVKPKNDANWLPPVIKVHKGDWMVLQLTPVKVQYADFKEMKSDIHDEYIHEVSL